MSNEPFSEAPCYDGYKAIRNQLCAYTPLALIGKFLEYLHQPFRRSSCCEWWSTSPVR